MFAINFCTVCNKSFAISSDLTLYYSKKHTNGRPCCCDICGRAFEDLRGLRQLGVVHTGGRRCECDVCNKLLVNILITVRFVKRLVVWLLVTVYFVYKHFFIVTHLGCLTPCINGSWSAFYSIQFA